MLAKSVVPAVRSIQWEVNPLEVIYSAWGTISAMSDNRAKLHLGGRMKLRDNTVVKLELWPALYEGELELTFSDGNEVFFLRPFDVNTGVEGAYLKLLEVLGELR